MPSINVTNNFIADITWLDAGACSFAIDNSIDVWKIEAQSAPALIDSLKTLLTADELTRAAKFYRQQDRDRFITGRAALRTILGKYLNLAPADVEFAPGLNKKPFIKNSNPHYLQFNASHSGDVILLAVSGSAIGADVEFINHDFGYSEVLPDNFSTDEINYITTGDAIPRFFKLWTRKEAITKATAQGLDCDLRLLPGLDGTNIVAPGIIASADDWVINSFNVDERYVASIAASPFTGKTSFLSLEGAEIGHYR